MRTKATIALTCAIVLMGFVIPAQAEAGFIAIDKSHLAGAEKLGVVIHVTQKEDGGYLLDLRITPLDEKAIRIELLIPGGSRIRLEKRLYDGKIFSEHYLAKELMSNGRVLIGGIAGHQFVSSGNMMSIDLSSFLKKD